MCTYINISIEKGGKKKSGTKNGRKKKQRRERSKVNRSASVYRSTFLPSPPLTSLSRFLLSSCTRIHVYTMDTHGSHTHTAFIRTHVHIDIHAFLFYNIYFPSPSSSSSSSSFSPYLFYSSRRLSFFLIFLLA